MNHPSSPIYEELPPAIEEQIEALRSFHFEEQAAIPQWEEVVR